MPENIYDLDYIELQNLIELWGYPSYRTKQVWQGLYQQLYSKPEDFTNLPHALREKLGSQFCEPKSDNGITFSKLNPGIVQLSADRETRKTLFTLDDGRLIEAVLMRYDKRQTLCISSQAGCAMGCVFCATGQMGFFRHLSSGEIVEQVVFYARLLASEGKPVTNVVVMGMGEPFHNYEETLSAIDRLNHPAGMNLGARRFTISTVGLAPVIRRFAAEKRQINLAVSLHAADNELRQSMLPINKKYPVEELMASCKDYIEQTHRRITFEWALIEGVNDTPEQAQKLGKLLRSLRSQDGTLLVHVNAIPLNPTREYQGKATSHERASIFQLELQKLGIPCTIRIRRGIDIQAGCGQLAGTSLSGS
jgi:23S rRNA (adenine2503-C2)-methyltransferase